MKKKLLAVVMAAMFATALMGCSDDEDYEDYEETTEETSAEDEESENSDSDMEAAKEAIESSIWQDDSDGLYYTFGDDGAFLLTNLETQESVEGTYEVVIDDEALMIEISSDDADYELFVSEFNGDTMVLMDTTDESTMSLTLVE